MSFKNKNCTGYTAHLCAI